MRCLYRTNRRHGHSSYRSQNTPSHLLSYRMYRALSSCTLASFPGFYQDDSRGILSVKMYTATFKSCFNCSLERATRLIICVPKGASSKNQPTRTIFDDEPIYHYQGHLLLLLVYPELKDGILSYGQLNELELRIGRRRQTLETSKVAIAVINRDRECNQPELSASVWFFSLL